MDPVSRVGPGKVSGSEAMHKKSRIGYVVWSLEGKEDEQEDDGVSLAMICSRCLYIVRAVAR
jgi:hypothetical protein